MYFCGCMCRAARQSGRHLLWYWECPHYTKTPRESYWTLIKSRERLITCTHPELPSTGEWESQLQKNNWPYTHTHIHMCMPTQIHTQRRTC